MHARAISIVKPGACVIVALAAGVGVELRANVALYESMGAPSSRASKPTVTIWLSWVSMDAVETFFVAPASTGMVRLS